MRERVSVLAKKVGMTSVFDKSGFIVPVTLLEIKVGAVLRVCISGAHGKNVLIGFDKKDSIRKKKGWVRYKDAFYGTLREFVVSPLCLLAEGDPISIEYIRGGQYIDATGYTIGKGMAGGMKRHGFAGLEASHGVSISHRAHGSTGNRTEPGKVFKNKKMAGHMGDVKVTIQNLKVVDRDTGLNVIAVKGAIPGSRGRLVFIRDAVKKNVFAERSL